MLESGQRVRREEGCCSWQLQLAPELQLAQGRRSHWLRKRSHWLRKLRDLSHVATANPMIMVMMLVMMLVMIRGPIGGEAASATPQAQWQGNPARAG